MADLEFVVGDFGDTYDIEIYDEETGSLMDISGFDNFTLTIMSTDEATTILSKSLTKVNDDGKVRWSMLSGDTASLSPGTYKAQITMVDSSVSIRRKTDLMNVRIIQKLD